MKLIYLGMLFSFIAMNTICMDNLGNPYNNQSIIHHSPEKMRNYKKYDKNQHYKECRKNKRRIEKQSNKQTLKK